MGHANARLTVYGRRLLVDRIHAGHAPAEVAHQLGVSRATAYKWLRRFAEEGPAGLLDRSSRPRRIPARTAPEIERRVLKLRHAHRRGAEWIAGELGLCPSTVGRILTRAGVPQLCRLDALSGEVVRSGPISFVRYEHESPGSLVHIDVKRLARISEGGGWRAHGRAERPNHHRGAGYEYVHALVDDHCRLAYAEIHADERGETCAEFLLRAAEFFAAYGIGRIERVMSDNAFGYRLSGAFQAALEQLGARHLLITPHCPWQNGKVERFNRTLLREWAYAKVFSSNQERADLLADWLTDYNTRRRHSALGGLPPVSRLSTTW